MDCLQKIGCDRVPAVFRHEEGDRIGFDAKGHLFQEFSADVGELDNAERGFDEFSRETWLSWMVSAIAIACVALAILIAAFLVVEASPVLFICAIVIGAAALGVTAMAITTGVAAQS